MFPDVEYFTDRDFFLENQIVCIVGREGTKFCSLIENRLFMRSQSRHISKRMQLIWRLWERMNRRFSIRLQNFVPSLLTMQTI